jgi:hypothetical protein
MRRLRVNLMSTPLYTDIIRHPSAWKSSDIGGKEGLMHRLGVEHIEALEEALDRTRHKRLELVTRADFDHPVLNSLMAAARDEIMSGHGAVILGGLDMHRFTLDDYARIYWGLGTHLGEAMPQSQRNDRIGHVQKEESNPSSRGYLMDIELGSHCDFHEILSLASFRCAREGGMSGVVSGLAIHNAILQSKPEHLDALYEGFHHVGAPDQPLSAQKVPVFANVGGIVSCYYHGMLWKLAARRLGSQLPQPLQDALEYFDSQARRPDLRADFMLEPGEMLFWHNFVCLHSRSSFKDTADHRRLLLRLWINPLEGRPMPEEFTAQARWMDVAHAHGRAGIDYSEMFAAQPL